MTPSFQRLPNSWPRKFRCAARGVATAIRVERNFRVHLALAATAVIAAMVLRAGVVEWGLLLLCIATVLAAEMFNSAIELLARSITSQENASVRDALDIGAGAVLLAALGSAVVGGLVLVHRLGTLAQWW